MGKFARPRRMIKRSTWWVGILLALAGCGGSDGNGGFTDTFRATDTVAHSIFAQSATPVAGDFRLTVVSMGVSSGFVKLNDDQLFGPSDFKNNSFEETLPVTLFEENTISVEVRGSPGDQLCAKVFEVITGQPDRVIFERCVDRAAGPPNHVDVVIDITPTPTPTATP